MGSPRGVVIVNVDAVLNVKGFGHKELELLERELVPMLGCDDGRFGARLWIGGLLKGRGTRGVESPGAPPLVATRDSRLGRNVIEEDALVDVLGWGRLDRRW